jgi:hypothetical protein
MQFPDVIASAGAKRFHRQRAATALPQVLQQQTSEHRLAHAGVGPGHKNNSPAHRWKFLTRA